MKIGNVVTHRVSTTDSMSVADLLASTNSLQKGMTFSYAVSIALASALQTLRDANLLPTRDGFEYNELMSNFTMNARNLRSQAVIHNLKLPTVATIPVMLAVRDEKVIMEAGEELQQLIDREEQGLTEQEVTRYKELERMIYG